MSSNSCLFFCVTAPTILPLDVGSFLSHKSLRVVLDHYIAASREVHYVQLYHRLSVSEYNILLFHSASIPGDHSNAHGISPVHYFFEHNSIPSPTIPQFVQSFSNQRASPHFPFFCHHKECGYKYFCASRFSYDLFWVQTPQCYGWIKRQTSLL